MYVEFQDTYKIIVKTVTQAAKEGSVKNPYDITVDGIGYLGKGKYTCQVKGVPGKLSKEYVSWKAILDRCYKEKLKDRYSAYYGICSVDDKWLNFQNFAEWYSTNKYPVEGRLHVDKDILVKDNKIYSEDTCLLVPQRINLIFMDYSRTVDTDLPTGIRRTKNGKRFHVAYNTTNIGTYDTLEECVELYNTAKRNHIRNVAEEYKNIVPKKVYDALVGW